MATEEDGGKKGCAKAQAGENCTLQAATDPRAGDVAGQDQGDRHGCGPRRRLVAVVLGLERPSDRNVDVGGLV